MRPLGGRLKNAVFGLMMSTSIIARTIALLVAITAALPTQAAFVRPQVTPLTQPQTTVVGTPFPQRVAFRLANPAGTPLSGVLVGFYLSRCGQTPLMPDTCPPEHAHPYFVPALDNADPLYVTGGRDWVAVRTDADGVARASTIVAGTQVMEAFVLPYILGQDTPLGWIQLQFPPVSFRLNQVAPVPVPALSSWLTLALLSACLAAGLIRLRRGVRP